MCLAGFMIALDALVVITALPSIQHDFRAGLSTVQWTVNAYGLTFAAGIITAAALGDRFGRRRLFVIGVGAFTVASAACALAPSIDFLIAARAVQGLGAAMVSPLSLTILASVFPPERRGTVIGIWGGIAGLAVASGPLVGGGLTQALSWHWIFWVNVPIGVAVSALCLRRVAESRGPATRLDLPAAGLISGAAVSLIWGLLRANEAGWGSVETVVAFTLGSVLLAGFIVWEGRAPEPMLPLRLFSSRMFTAANASGFLMMAALIPAAFLISQYLQVVLGNSPFNAGLRFLPMTATPLVVAPLAGMLSDRIGPRPLMITGLLLQGVGLAWFALAATTGVAYSQLILPLLIAGVGVSMPFATTATAILSAVKPADMGKASGTSNTLQQLGGAFGIAIATAVFAAGAHGTTPVAFDAGFRPALAVAAATSLLGAVTATAVASRRLRSARIAPEPALAVVNG
ncbi:MAG TPA: DHA2 family efflux MFS transporter permease subunit [Candidatus Dormibacteraeota bacterium]|jgi:EmrB/QacA subfamily drug resistance transporter|nr:DHA2 family efflux MFS transporter permease subunit [Candidatus Dormibacteraeota bacterium]